MSVEEGGNITLTCSSSIPNLNLAWRLPRFQQRSGPDILIVGASTFDEGSYRCAVLEGGEVPIASAMVLVDVIISEFTHYCDH